MTYLVGPKDTHLEAAANNLPGQAVMVKFGYNPDIDIASTPEDIWGSGGVATWQTTAQTLSTVSASANDASGGSGAITVKFFGLDGNFNEIEEEITLNGVGAVLTTNTFLRVFRAYVTSVGTYHGANDGILTTTYSSTGNAAISILAGKGQSETTLYTIPAGKVGFLHSYGIHYDSTGTPVVDMTLWQCPNADDVATPFSGAKRVVVNLAGLNADQRDILEVPIRLAPKTDLWWTCTATTVNNVRLAATFSLILIDEDQVDQAG